MKNIDRIYFAFFAGLVAVAAAFGMGLSAFVQALLNVFYSALRAAGLM